MAAAGDVNVSVNEGDKGEKTTAEQLGDGPTSNRGCTDCWCLLVLLGAWAAYLFVTVLGFADGNPAKLYLPRDFSGGYCDVENNWNDGTKTKGFPKQSFTMNTSAATDLIVKQFMCSTAVVDLLTKTKEVLAQDEHSDYLCACCLIPCAKCEGSLQTGDDFTDTLKLGSAIGNKLNELQGATDPSRLFSAGGANGNVFMDMWNSVDQYFNKVCLKECTLNFNTLKSSSSPREYIFSLAPDNMMSNAFNKLKKAPTDGRNGQTITNLQNAITNQFKFKALPLDACPYDPSRCVPMPGIEFEEISAGYCTFKMSAEVVNSIGSAASDAFVGLGGESLVSGLGETFGKWVGEFQRSIPAFIIVTILAFVTGFIYLVLLRFAVGLCVWLSIFVVLLIMALGGASCYVRASQCAGADFLETGKQIGAGALIAASGAFSSGCDEKLEGEGHNYKGCQKYSKGLNKCIKWGDASSSSIMKKYSLKFGSDAGTGIVPAAVYSDRLHNDYCRNPCDIAGADCNAKSIWCFTSNADQAWEECQPVGVVKPTCSNGYAIKSSEMRTLLEVCAYVLWALAVLYLIGVICMTNRIRLAIAVSKVAAIFMRQNTMIVLTPAIQSLISCIWCLVWVLSASFLLSQVPDDAVDKGAFLTYAEAYGTDTTPGKCTNSWPSGSVWKDETNCEQINGTYACWRCAPPRYTFDWRFAVSFFVFLWNNALMIAIGQFVVAAACSCWFFTQNSQKGSTGVIRKAIHWTWRYHLGSLAFGSFIIAVVQMIRYVLYYYEQQAKAQKNRVMVIILKICQCLLWCFEKCIKFLNENAYIQIALHGSNFCISAKNAFYLILRNALRFGVISVVGKGIRVIGIFFITAGTGVVGYFVFTAMYADMTPTVPVIIYVFVGYVVGKLFVNVYGLAMDTVLQCFLACEEMGKVEAGEDGYLPSPLRGWLKEKPALEE
eukprot:TRINITY_DN906_c0_g1_i2.p1 TRINITY_DN906_c0_g1~~TRINITY_DN906_c0_g1_i2.p1  ORF type:complete len:958 (-),score=156.63 TRINITY_DN906_c0_g1_i2:177-3011(-)